MGQGARSALTLSVLGVLLMVAAVWAWGAATEPLPGKAEPPVCVDRTIPAGEKVYPQDVTVSVYNAGTREGLAGRVMKDLVDAGFHEGSSGNAAPTVRVGVVEIWTPTKRSPDVRLVASLLGDNVTIRRRDSVGYGVTVVVGDGFGEVGGGRKSAAARSEATICSPPVD